MHMARYRPMRTLRLGESCDSFPQCYRNKCTHAHLTLYVEMCHWLYSHICQVNFGLQKLGSQLPTQLTISQAPACPHCSHVNPFSPYKRHSVLGYQFCFSGKLLVVWIGKRKALPNQTTNPKGPGNKGGLLETNLDNPVKVSSWVLGK